MDKRGERGEGVEERRECVPSNDRAGWNTPAEPRGWVLRWGGFALFGFLGRRAEDSPPPPTGEIS